ncbi:uncharacterized protein LOC144887828 [Branchiostoma floridae x Branchiostoma japonicum]
MKLSATDKSDDNPGGHVHTERDDNNTLKQIAAAKKSGDQLVNIEAGKAFSITVGGNLIGLAANNMYTTGTPQQSGNRELPEIPRWSTEEANPYDNDEDADSHVYHNSDTDDINSLQRAATNKEQRADEEEDTASSTNVQKDGSDMLNNPTYIPGALRQDNKKGQTWLFCTSLRPCLLRCVIIAVAMASLVASRVVTSIYLTRTPENKAKLYPLVANQTFTTNLSFGTTGHELETASSVENMTTTLQVVKATTPAVTTLLQDGTTPMSNFTTNRTVVTTELKAMTTILLDMITTHRECLLATGVMKRSEVLSNTNQDNHVND